MAEFETQMMDFLFERVMPWIIMGVVIIAIVAVFGVVWTAFMGEPTDCIVHEGLEYCR